MPARSVKTVFASFILFLGFFIQSGIFNHRVWGEDLLQVYHLAEENDPTIQSDKYRNEASLEILKQAYSKLLPSIVLEGEYVDTRQEIIESDVAVFGQGISSFPVWDYTFTLIQPLLDYPSFVRVDQARHEVERADIEYESKKEDLILRVAELYVNVLKAQDDLAYDSTEEASLVMHFELAKVRYDAGLAPITDYHDAKARLASVSARRIESENALKDSLEALTGVTGKTVSKVAGLGAEPEVVSPAEVPVPQVLDFKKEKMDDPEPGPAGSGKSTDKPSEAPDLPLAYPFPNNVDPWVDKALTNNLSLKIQKQQVEVALKEIEAQKGAHWPTVDLVGRYNRRNANGSLFGGGSDVDTREALVQLSFPIFSGFSIRSKTNEARKLYQATLQDFEKETRRVRRETRAAFLGIGSAVRSVQAFNESVISSQLSLEGKSEGYNSGLFTSLAVLDAERDLYLAKRDFSNAQYDYILNCLRLKQAVGALSEEDLAIINQWLAK